MDAVLRKPMSRDQFLAREERQEPDAFVVCSPVPRGAIVISDPVGVRACRR